MNELKHTVLVTGATSGFGAAIAKRYLMEGHKVIALGRRKDRLVALQKEASRLEQSLLYTHVLDVTDKESVIALPTQLPQEFTAVTVLVNNAWLGLGLEPAYKALQEDWECMVDTNIKGLMSMTHAFLPGMVQRHRGHVINLGSIAAHHSYPGGNVYGASKAFVHQFTENLKADLLGTPVRVTDISPGLCSGTEFSDVRFKGDTQRAAQVYEGVQALTPDDIAEAIYWVSMLPAHVNINHVKMMPTCQAPSSLSIYRKPI